MGYLIGPRHTADLDYIHSAIKIYYDAQDWVSTADYKNGLVDHLQNIKKESVRNNDETHYTKCSEIPRYFGFLERKFSGKSNSEVRITDLGRDYYRTKCEEWSLTQEVVDNFIMKDLGGTNYGSN